MLEFLNATIKEYEGCAPVKIGAPATAPRTLRPSSRLTNMALS